jgi:hypothetical protein
MGVYANGRYISHLPTILQSNQFMHSASPALPVQWLDSCVGFRDARCVEMAAMSTICPTLSFVQQAVAAGTWVQLPTLNMTSI